MLSYLEDELSPREANHLPISGPKLQLCRPWLGPKEFVSLKTFPTEVKCSVCYSVLSSGIIYQALIVSLVECLFLMLQSLSVTSSPLKLDTIPWKMLHIMHLFSENNAF